MKQNSMNVKILTAIMEPAKIWNQKGLIVSAPQAMEEHIVRLTLMIVQTILVRVKEAIAMIKVRLNLKRI